MAITNVTVDGGMEFKVWTTNNPWRKGSQTAQDRGTGGADV